MLVRCIEFDRLSTTEGELTVWKLKIRTKESLDVYATALLGLEGDPRLLLPAKEV